MEIYSYYFARAKELYFLPSSSDMFGTFSFGTLSIYIGLSFWASSMACWASSFSKFLLSCDSTPSTFVGCESTAVSLTSLIAAS